MLECSKVVCCITSVNATRCLFVSSVCDCLNVGKVGDSADSEVSTRRISAAVNNLFIVH